MKTFFMVLLCGGVYLAMPQIASAHAAIIGNQAWRVCEDQARSDSCEYSDNHDNVYRGTCQLMSENLLCVRNQPIEKAGPDSAHSPEPEE